MVWKAFVTGWRETVAQTACGSFPFRSRSTAFTRTRTSSFAESLRCHHHVGSTYTTTRTGSQSGSTTSTLDNTKTENKLGELEAGLGAGRRASQAIIDKVAPKKVLDKIKDKMCPCLPGKAAKGLEDGDQGADDAATDAPENQEMDH